MLQGAKQGKRRRREKPELQNQIPQKTNGEDLNTDYVNSWNNQTCIFSFQLSKWQSFQKWRQFTSTRV